MRNLLLGISPRINGKLPSIHTKGKINHPRSPNLSLTPRQTSHNFRHQPIIIAFTILAMYAYTSGLRAPALALFMYPHSVTGLLSAAGARVVKRNMALLPYAQNFGAMFPLPFVTGNLLGYSALHALIVNITIAGTVSAMANMVSTKDNTLIPTEDYAVID